MFFSYYEEGHGELCFQSLVYPFEVFLSEGIPDLLIIGQN